MRGKGWSVVLGGIAVASLAAVIPLSVFARLVGDGVVALVIGVPCTAIGFLVARRQPRRVRRQARCGFHSSSRAASRSWTEAAMILLRRGIPAGLRRVLACSCADCRDAAAHRAE